MSFVSRFIVLIENRRRPRAAAATVTAVSRLLSGFGLTAAHGASANIQLRDKVARDLDNEIKNTGAPKAKWARDLKGVRHVQAVVISNDTDEQMSSPRATTRLARVKRNVNVINTSATNWTTGANGVTSLKPGSAAQLNHEDAVAADSVVAQDPYGHGTHVAAVAAGRYYAPTTNSGALEINGVAPNANIYDVRVLNGLGFGTLSDALEGIQWAIYHAKKYNIRVLNLSLAASSTESWQTDPLCVAVRSAAAAGITVVVAAGNFGLNLAAQETYGRVSSPGNDPVNNFSSRGPTRSSYIDTSGVRRVDNLLKPDLVAPGNKIVGAAATAGNALTRNYLGAYFKTALVDPLGVTPRLTETQMMLSGTSVAAPALAGTVALMLQANPGLTPPLIKAILQYSAQPLPNANLLQQGAGLLNVDGAVTLVKALRTDLATAISAGTVSAGGTMLAPGKATPAATSTINGNAFNWSRMVYAGGTSVLSSSALFTQYQPMWDPRITWGQRRGAQARGGVLVGQRHCGQHLRQVVHRRGGAQPDPAGAGCGQRQPAGRHQFQGRPDGRVHPHGHAVGLADQRQRPGAGQRTGAQRRSDARRALTGGPVRRALTD